jgi:hypothetical protein
MMRCNHPNCVTLFQVELLKECRIKDKHHTGLLFVEDFMEVIRGKLYAMTNSDLMDLMTLCQRDSRDFSGEVNYDEFFDRIFAGLSADEGRLEAKMRNREGEKIKSDDVSVRVRARANEDGKDGCRMIIWACVCLYLCLYAFCVYMLANTCAVAKMRTYINAHQHTCAHTYTNTHAHTHTHAQCLCASMVRSLPPLLPSLPPSLPALFADAVARLTVCVSLCALVLVDSYHPPP